eukprot:3478177-Rhodomonas_salina.1
MVPPASSLTLGLGGASARSLALAPLRRLSSGVPTLALPFSSLSFPPLPYCPSLSLRPAVAPRDPPGRCVSMQGSQRRPRGSAFSPHTPAFPGHLSLTAAGAPTLGGRTVLPFLSLST